MSILACDHVDRWCTLYTAPNCPRWHWVRQGLTGFFLMFACSARVWYQGDTPNSPSEKGRIENTGKPFFTKSHPAGPYWYCQAVGRIVCAALNAPVSSASPIVQTLHLPALRAPAGVGAVRVALALRYDARRINGRASWLDPRSPPAGFRANPENVWRVA